VASKSGVCVARSLKILRRRVVQEQRFREQRRQGATQVVRRDPLTIYAFEHDAWPAIVLLDDPTISARIKSLIRPRLIALLGQQRILYLESCSEPPEAQMEIRDVTARLVESRVLEDLSEPALVDRMMQTSQDNDISSVQAVLREPDGIIQILSYSTG